MQSKGKRIKLNVESLLVELCFSLLSNSLHMKKIVSSVYKKKLYKNNFKNTKNTYS